MRSSGITRTTVTAVAFNRESALLHEVTRIVYSWPTRRCFELSLRRRASVVLRATASTSSWPSSLSVNAPLSTAPNERVDSTSQNTTIVWTIPDPMHPSRCGTAKISAPTDGRVMTSGPFWMTTCGTNWHRARKATRDTAVCRLGVSIASSATKCATYCWSGIRPVAVMFDNNREALTNVDPESIAATLLPVRPATT